MIRTISSQVDVPVSRRAAFDYLSDHRHVTNWMFGVSAFVPVGDVMGAEGDEFDAAISMGVVTLRSRLRVTNWRDGESLSLASVRGIESHSRLQISNNPDDTSRCILAAELSYRLPGGMAGRVARQAADPFAQLAMRQTERNISRHIQQWRAVTMSQ